ncbi:unnamed protein product, partial [Polarella glacialis]
TGLLLVCFDDGLLAAGVPAEDGTSLENLRVLQMPSQERASQAVSYSQLLEWEGAIGVFIGFSKKQNAVHLIHIAGVGRAVTAGSGGHTVAPVGMPPGNTKGAIE